MAEPHAHSQPIQTYGPAPHNRNIWPSPTPTANQYKHMAEPHTIDYVTPGRFFCLLFKPPLTHYLLSPAETTASNLDVEKFQKIFKLNVKHNLFFKISYSQTLKLLNEHVRNLFFKIIRTPPQASNKCIRNLFFKIIRTTNFEQLFFKLLRNERISRCA